MSGGNPFHRDESAAPISEVNVVPLADVSLVLLIILLVLSPMAAQSMLKVQSAAAKAAPPKAPSAEDLLPQRPPEPVLAVGLSPAGYVVEGRFIGGDAELRAWLVPELARRDDKKVFLAPELETPHGRVVSALEAISGMGAPAVALVQVHDPAASAPAGDAAPEAP
ncbi:MAG: biopolymer transporter ExbD [Elusimicrobiota bacterium]|nr:biopolymer transporter ExbD [Elusimicrobiota bacterium]